MKKTSKAASNSKTNSRSHSRLSKKSKNQTVGSNQLRFNFRQDTECDPTSIEEVVSWGLSDFNNNLNGVISMEVL